MKDTFEAPYNPEETESRIYKKWEESGYFNPDLLPPLPDGSPRSELFTIVMPPPNANGSLHAGHALFVTLQDIMIRYQRMQGKKTLWLPGADHAGFETQVVYEKKLEKEGRSRFTMDPQDLYNEILAFTLENKEIMENQVRSLGASCDWSREKFTLDPAIVKTVQETFIKMYNDELVYRGNRTVNWCSKHQTSLSDVETENTEETTPFYTFKYGPFEIGTVRPETKFGDKYVVMHPDDARYAQYKHGDTFDLEWINGPITATVIKDESVDPAFGTGVMTITPWHSQIDFEIAKRHGLDMEQIIDWRGKLLPIAGEFEGMKITEAREKIVEKLAAKGLLVSTDNEYKNVVKRCYKCATMIEPQIKDQWFVKMAPLAQMAIEAVNAGNIRFIPEHEEKIFRYWMENTMDWNISRQIVWGISVPAWFRNRGTEKEEVAVGIIPPEGTGWEKDTDTFDTWFSSGQWPLIMTGYPERNDSQYYPTDVMETGRDLIFKWVPRMIIFGLYLRKTAPFHTVYLHGMVNDAQGKKMSKSKGNVVNPLEVTAKYGTDALRMSLVVGNTPGTDLAFREDKVKGYKHFANKIWNIARFILTETDGMQIDRTVSLTKEDATLRSELIELAKDITSDFTNYRIHLASDKIYHYLWDRFASELLEESKGVFKEGSEEAKLSRKNLLLLNFADALALLHPIMPFVTEEIWSALPHKEAELLMVAPWPTL